MKWPWAALTERVRQLPLGLQEHIERVRSEALPLARRFAVDSAAVEAAVLLHDLARAESVERLLHWAAETGWKVTEVEQAFPLFLHGPCAAHWGREELGVTDAAVLQAVAYHTTACREMAPVAQVLFLADKLEPGKATLYPGLEGVRRWVERDPSASSGQSLARAVLELLTWHVQFYAGRGQLLHPATIEARNWLLLQLGSVS